MSYGKTSDSTRQMPRIDATTHTMQSIDYEHHEIHAGSHFFYTDKNTLGSAGTVVYLLTTPNTTKWSHLVYLISGSAITTIDIYEGADRVGDVAQTAYNSNRTSATTPTLVIHKAITGAGSTDGTLIWTRSSGSSSGQRRTGMEATRGGEKILKQNTKYIIRITSGTASNLTNIDLEWYEHTDKSDLT